MPDRPLVDNATRGKPPSTSLRLLAVIQERPGISKADLAAALPDISPKNFAKTFRTLHLKSRIRGVPADALHLTDEGAAYLRKHAA